MAFTGQAFGKYHIKHNSIPCECYRKIQLYEDVLRLTGFEKNPYDEQNCSNIENNLGRPDSSAIGFHDIPKLISGNHFLAFVPSYYSLQNVSICEKPGNQVLKQRYLYSFWCMLMVDTNCM
jgi:hypothetical protein